MRSKNAIYTSLSSLVLQMTRVLSSFILPKLMIMYFGSSANGLISSINQFLSYISLADSGANMSAKSALYKPLAEKDTTEIAKIVRSLENFYRKLAVAFIVYAFVVAVSFKFISNNEFSWFFSFSLTIILSANLFFQYFFGNPYSVLVKADQKSYVINFVKAALTITNVAVMVWLIQSFRSIHIAQVGAMAVFLVFPIFINRYAAKRYCLPKINKKDITKLSQRWDAFWHSTAAFFKSHTDVVIITAFMGLKEVSVYSIYLMVVNAVAVFVGIVNSGYEAAFGDMLAKNEQKNLQSKFNMMEFIIASVSVILFSSTAILIVPFVRVYIGDISDVNYIRPIFAYLITASCAVSSLNTIYTTLIYAAGHFRQTRNMATIEVIINVILSLILVPFLGISGVVIGTLVSAVYRIISSAKYLSKNILNRNLLFFIKRQIVSLVSVVLIISVAAILFRDINPQNIWWWLLYGFGVFIEAILCSIVVNLLFCRENTKYFLNYAKNVIKRM